MSKIQSKCVYNQLHTNVYTNDNNLIYINCVYKWVYKQQYNIYQAIFQCSIVQCSWFNVQWSNRIDKSAFFGFLWVGSSGHWISSPSKFGSSEVLCLCALSRGNTDVVLGSFQGFKKTDLHIRPCIKQIAQFTDHYRNSLSLFGYGGGMLFLSLQTVLPW